MDDDETCPPEVLEKKWQYRVAHLESVIKQQFQLSYFGTVSYEASQDMPIHEREYLFNLLKEQKESETKARETAIREAKIKRESSGSGARRTRSHRPRR